MSLDDETFASLTETRVVAPHKIAEALAARRRRNTLTQDGMLFIVAADHTARAMVGLYDDPLAMADRRSMLDRLLTALDHPRVDGVLGSAEIIDDLALLDALHDKVAVGTMNRGGLAGASWTIDDRFTAFDTAHLRACQPRRRQVVAAHRLPRRRHRPDPRRSGARRCRSSTTRT